MELYNSGPGSQDLGGWRIAGDLGEFVIPGGTTIPADSYFVFDDLGGIFDEIGGEVSVIDDVGGTQDRVQYGTQGGAPLPHEDPSVSLSRAPDASDGPPLAPPDDAVWWTLDLTATFNERNDAPPADLGSSLLINELQPFPVLLQSGDRIELYNPTMDAIFPAGWFVALGSGIHFNAITLPIPPGGFQVWELPPGLELEDTRLVYLFDADSVRVDQVGFDGIPPGVAPGGGAACVGRCPDGAGPNDGFDFETSGGGHTFIELTCTLEQTNGAAPECDGGVRVRDGTWGRIKSGYR